MGRDSKPGNTAKGKYSIILAGQSISYDIKRSPKAKHIRLEVRSETGLTVIIPRLYNAGELPALIKKKQRWILEKIAKYNNNQTSRQSNTVKNGDSVLYLGQGFEVVGVQSYKNHVTMNVESNRLEVGMKTDNRGLSVILEGWYRKQAANLIEEKAKKLCVRMGITYNRISIRGQKTRWGSCSKQGNLSFNWKLIMAPEPVVDYVIIHELAHLIEMNHSKRFWQIVENNCPNWSDHRKWLKEHII